jgi:hypothetical protein
MKMLAGFLLLIGNFGCRAPVTINAGSEADFAQRVGNFPYVASSTRQETILANYSKLRVGMSKPEVGALLGEPDYGELTRPGKFADPDGSCWKYHLYKAKKRWTNEEQDRLVYAFFDEAGKIYWIEPWNIDGLVRVGQPVRE